MSKSVNRTGRVSSVNYEAGTYEVTYFDRGKSVTRTINAMSNGEYLMPTVGQVVSVNHASNGTVMGTTTGTIWNATNKPAEGFKGLYRKEYSPSVQGKAYERYDANTGIFVQCTDTRTGRNCKGTIYDEAGGAAYFTAGGLVMLQSRGASASVQAKAGVGIVAGTTVSIEAGTAVSIEASGDMSTSVGGEQTMTVTGKSERTYKSDLTVNVTGTVSVTIGGATITVDSGGNVNVSAPQITVNGSTGDVTVEGISLKNHTHSNGNGGSPTGAPIA